MATRKAHDSRFVQYLRVGMHWVYNLAAVGQNYNVKIKTLGFVENVNVSNTFPCR